MNVAVLGTGLIGSAIVRDLAAVDGVRVTAVDGSSEALRALAGVPGVTTRRLDLRGPGAVAEALAGADLAVCAVPGFMGFEVLRAVIDAGRDVVDISFFPEDAFALDGLARSRGVTAIVDCGVAPGLCNLLAGHADSLLDRSERYLCYVGGLPQVRRRPFEYGVVFSASDVIEEYTRPARLREAGRELVLPALSEVEQLDLPGVGTLEAFNTDGLRTLLRTFETPFMKEKTLRYPGHAELMRVFRDSGFFATEPIEVAGGAVRPLDLTSQLLFAQWRLDPGEADLTVMRVIVEGERDGRARRFTFDLLDRYDPVTATTSMARTTGYTCSAAVRLLIGGLWTAKGIVPPEELGRRSACYLAVMGDLEARGVRVLEDVHEGGAAT